LYKSYMGFQRLASSQFPPFAKSTPLVYRWVYMDVTGNESSMADLQCGPHDCLTGNFPVSFTYDLMGYVDTATHGAVFTYSYDTAGYLTQETVVSQFEFSAGL
jgi:hypothetical protein